MHIVGRVFAINTRKFGWESRKVAGISVTDTKILGLKIVTPIKSDCYINHLITTYDWNEYCKHDLSMKFVQENESLSRYGVLRGMHVQKSFPQGKLVRVLEGEIFDVVIDLRLNSKTFGHWEGINLSARNLKQFYIPRGFAHGFYVKSDYARVLFKVTDYWHPNDEIGIRWDDPVFAIQWNIPPGECPKVADKDLCYSPFCIDKLSR